MVDARSLSSILPYQSRASPVIVAAMLRVPSPVKATALAFSLLALLAGAARPAGK